METLHSETGSTPETLKKPIPVPTEYIAAKATVQAEVRDQSKQVLAEVPKPTDASSQLPEVARSHELDRVFAGVKSELFSSEHQKAFAAYIESKFQKYNLTPTEKKGVVLGTMDRLLSNPETMDLLG